MRVHYFVAAVVVATIALGLYLVFVHRVPEEKPLAYWPIDDRTLQVAVLDAPNRECEIAQVEESDKAVHIHAVCQRPAVHLPQTGMAQKFVLEVTLLESLGSRSVRDGLGRPADRCQLPGLDCIASQ